MREVLPRTWPWEIRAVDALPEKLQKVYLSDVETRALGGQRHEAQMYEPMGTALVGTVAAAVVGAYVGNALASTVLLLVVVALWLRTAWKWIVWENDLLFITGYRIVYLHGVLNKQVDMMPIGKVTDMRYQKPLIGQILGYGLYIVESAGQDQALREINFVPDPDNTYKYLQNLLFRRSVTEVSIVNVDTDKPLRVRQRPTRTVKDTRGYRTYDEDDETGDF